MRTDSPIVITAGEPAGIGVDLLIQLAQQQPLSAVVIADHTLLQQRAQQLRLPLHILPYRAKQAISAAIGCLTVLHVPLRAPCEAGCVHVANAPYVLEMLQTAGQGCIDGEFAAVVTAPVHKSIMQDAGIAFSGHTEFFANLTQTTDVVMLLVAKDLRVALVTTHLPLSAVPHAITAARITQTLKILRHDLSRYFGLSSPRILVCGLNPHAGEGGHLGREEIEIISPALTTLRNEGGWQLQGPLSADTVFTPHYLAQADVIVAMYHDQGLPVLKHYGFGAAVNITLGLPIIRTSVDHGTALDLAGTGRAETGSLQAAIEMAEFMLQQQKNRHNS